MTRPAWMPPPEYLYLDARLGGTARQVRADRPDAKYLWDPPLGPHRQADLLYGGDQLPDDARTPIVVCEGGKVAAAIVEAGAGTAVGLVSASTMPSDHILRLLAGRPIILWPDNDAPGRALMGKVGRALEVIGISELRIVHWDDAPEHGDAADLAPERIRELVAAAAWIGPIAALVDEHENPSVNGRPEVRFMSARDLVTDAPATVDYVVRPWLAVGTITELDGKPKAAGKTTFILHLIRAVMDGAPFLGEPDQATAVVLLTEQSRASLAPTLRAIGLDRDELRVLTWPDAFGTPWPEIVAAAVDECDRIGARLLVVDTLGQFTGIRGDAENDAGTALEAMAPLQTAAAHGLAVLVSRHDRKAGGDVGESGRGSNAWSGAVDCIVAIRRPLNPARPTIRELEAISRRGDVPAEPILIELTDAGYVVLGSETAVAFGEAQSGILATLDDGEWHTEKEVAESLPDASRTTIRDAMAVLISTNVVERGPRGRVTEPYPYRLTPLTDALSSTPVNGVNGTPHAKSRRPLTDGYIPSTDETAPLTTIAVDGGTDDDDEPEDVDNAIVTAFPLRPGLRVHDEIAAIFGQDVSA